MAALVLPLVYLPVYARDVGVKAMLGNRDGLPERTGVAARGTRAHANLIENLVPYACIVLTAQAMGVSNPVTHLAGLVFLAARLVHAASYLAGIPVIRTMAYYAGLFATAAIALQLFI
jgi:uncharacterized MAPEG superfamily protein